MNRGNRGSMNKNRDEQGEGWSKEVMDEEEGKGGWEEKTETKRAGKVDQV